MLVGKDVTARILTKEKLIQSEKKYRSLFNHSPFMIIILDTHGIIVDFNPTVSEIGGYHDEDIIGMRFQDLKELVPQKYYQKLMELFSKLSNMGKIEPAEVQFKKVDGTLIWVKLFAKLVKVEGETFIQVILSDITDLKERFVDK